MGDAEDPETKPLCSDVQDGSFNLIVLLLTWFGCGLIVCATYAWGIVALSPNAMRLWGSIYTDHPWLYVVYNVAISMAALGFFTSLAFLCRISSELRRGRVLTVCAVFHVYFLAEYCWMPLCVAYIRNPIPALYWAIRIVLFVAGVLGLVWAGTICSISEEEGPSAGAVLRCLGRIGACIFALHCAVLDAIVWPPFFK